MEGQPITGSRPHESSATAKLEVYPMMFRVILEEKGDLLI